jgi:HlyD family secretion protein
VKGFGVKKSHKIIVVVVVSVVVLAGAWGLWFWRARKSKKAETVRIEKAGCGELMEFVSAPGEIEPLKKVEISAKVSARIVEMTYEEGDRVTCGDPAAEPPVASSVLIQLDSKDLESHLRSAQAGRSAQAAHIEVEKSGIASQRAGLEGLAASLEEAERDFVDTAKYKADGLRAQFAAAKHTLKSAELNLVVLKHNLEAADARIEQAEEALSYTTIRSPIDGVVTRINAEVGEVVMTGTMNNPGTVIMEVADLSQMLVVAEVDEADIGELEIGQEAKVYVQAFEDIELKGTVDSIALTHRWSRQGTKYFRTEILLANDANVGKLYSGLTADVDIQTRRHAGVIKVPSQAVLAREVDSLPLEIRDNCAELDKNKSHATVVYGYNDGKAVVRPVKIGASDLTHTIITAGVSEGDGIVVGPYKVLDGLKHDQNLKDEREVEADKKAESKQADANEPEK